METGCSPRLSRMVRSDDLSSSVHRSLCASAASNDDLSIFSVIKTNGACADVDFRRSWSLASFVLSPSHVKRQRGFTLIELLVVVTIFGVVAAVVVPTVLTQLGTPSPPDGGDELQVSPPSAEASGAGQPAKPLKVVASDVNVRLEAKPVLSGLSVRTRFEASLTGRFKLRTASSADHVAVHLPFPSGVREVRDVVFKVVGLDETHATYDLTGIRWSGPVPASGVVECVVEYRAVGSDVFAYDVAGQGRADHVRFTVTLAANNRAVVGVDSLQPTSRDRNRLIFEYDNLVSDRLVTIEIPADESPLGKLLLLSKLAAFAVFLFGAGFWYFSEADKPGALDDFRWGHFFLLASNFCAFFVVFAILMGLVRPSVAIVSAYGSTMPLLALHVARIRSLRFASDRAVPLALFSQGIVIAYVLLEWHRPIVGLSSAFVALIALTLTYRTFFEKRRQHEDDRDVEREKVIHVSKLEALVRKSKEQTETLRILINRAQRGLDMHSELSGPVPSALCRALQAANSILEVDYDDEQGTLSGIYRTLQVAEQHVTQQKQSIDRITSLESRLIQEVERAERRADVGATEVSAHCSACGAVVQSEHQYCPSCGQAVPDVWACADCATEWRLPVQLLAQPGHERPLHCERCGGPMDVRPQRQHPGPIKARGEADDARVDARPR